jgi:hypothetical protein
VLILSPETTCKKQTPANKGNKRAKTKENKAIYDIYTIIKIQ